MEEYLAATYMIDSDSPVIIMKAQSLTQGQDTFLHKAQNLFYFVRDEIKYNPYSPFYLPEHYRASAILTRGQGYCVQKSALLAALCRASGIPSRLHFADIRNFLMPPKLARVAGTDLLTYHCYTEIYIEERWIKATPSFDRTTCTENRIAPVEFDGILDAMLHSHNLDGKLHIEYVKDHGCYSDVPLNQILDAWNEVYGKKRVAEYKRTFIW